MPVSFLLLLVPQIAAAQRSVAGTVYDSLLRAPLRGADVWVRGSERHAETGADGRFRLDSVVPGRYTLLVSHPGLDSAGLFTLAVPITITAGENPVSVATPSLATLWRRRGGAVSFRCGKARARSSMTMARSSVVASRRERSG